MIAQAKTAEMPTSEERVALVQKLARIAARRLSDVPGFGTPGELLGVIWMAVEEAFRAFQPGRGVKFETYASERVRGAILDEQREWDYLSRLLRQRAKAGTLRLDLLSLNAWVNVDGEDKAMERGDYTASEAENGMEAVERRELVELLLKSAGGGNNEVAIRAYFLEEMTMEQVGALIDRSQSRVCQMIARALARIVAAVEKQGIEA